MIETFHSKRFQWLCDFRFEIDPSDWWTAVAAFLSYYNFKFYKFALKLCYNFASDLFTFLPIRTNRLAAFHIAISIVAAGEQAELWFLVPVLLHSWHGFRAQIASACRSSVTEVQSAALQSALRDFVHLRNRIMRHIICIWISMLLILLVSLSRVGDLLDSVTGLRQAISGRRRCIPIRFEDFSGWNSAWDFKGLNFFVALTNAAGGNFDLEFAVNAFHHFGTFVKLSEFNKI